MKLILVMVTSLDGRSTQKSTGSNIHSWTSREDQKHFQKIIDSAHLVIMGSSTFETIRNSIKHRDDLRRVVITHNPSKYESEKIPGKLEFTNEAPTELIKRMEKQGYKEGYLVGGAHTNTSFFKGGLITELWQTVEPRILGMGNGIVGEEAVDFSLKLISIEKMNRNGALLLKYQVA